MKKNMKIIIAVIVGVAILVGAVFGIGAFLKNRRIAELVNEQNYVAAKLLEMSMYDKGEMLAMKSEQTSPNQTARELIALSNAFQAKFDTVVDCADAWLDSTDSDVLRRVTEIAKTQIETVTWEGGYNSYGYVASYRLDDESRKELIDLLKQVREGIKIGRNIASMQTIIDAYTGGFYGTAPVELEKDDSMLALKVRTAYAIQSGNSTTAKTLAEKLFKEDDSFENRVMLANIAAFDEAYAYEDKTEPIKRAINFIETTTPQKERDLVEYDLELAYLHYYAGNEDTARKQLADAFEVKEFSPVALLAGNMSDTAKTATANSGGSYTMQTLWSQCKDLIYLPTVWDDERNFFDFLCDFIDHYHKGVIIRDIDASDFPTVRVRVNISDADETEFGRGDFRIDDMGKEIGSIKLISNQQEISETDTSVMLVVDRSGSMGGDPILYTKSAVERFVDTISPSIRVGLAAFDSYAALLSPLDTVRAQTRKAIADVDATGGGTNIYSGLECALEALRGESGRKFAILLSDGADGSSSRIDDVLERLVAEGIIVYTIGFGSADETYLKYIAESCGGRYLYADSTELLYEIYSSIGQNMDNDYILEFKATETMEDFSRELSVSVEKIFSHTNREYHVGVTQETIDKLRELEIAYSPFRQVGGSGISD